LNRFSTSGWATEPASETRSGQVADNCDRQGRSEVALRCDRRTVRVVDIRGSVDGRSGSITPPLRAGLTVGICLCEALAYAHSANVLHGDIKPSNVFVDPAANAAKLADFGIARVVGGADRNALVTKLVGTPSYMAPEQKLLGAKVGPRTDLYLLSRTLADFIGASLNQRGEVELPDDVSLAATVAVLKRGLAPEPANRPEDARVFGRLLQDALVAV
jgi:serine/threonine-protein kinase PknK